MREHLQRQQRVLRAEEKGLLNASDFEEEPYLSSQHNSLDEYASPLLQRTIRNSEADNVLVGADIGLENGNAF